MTLYRSQDADSAGGEPSYAGLAARLKKLPTYDHPNSQALLDKLASGELDSEECLHLLTQDAITRTQQAQDHARQIKEHDTLQQQEQEQAQQKLNDEIASNAALDEPIMVNADGTTDTDTDAPAEAADTPPSPVASTPKSSTGNSSTTRAHGAFAESGLSGSSGSFSIDDAGGFDTPAAGNHAELDEDDERGPGFED